ncbi:MAG: 23S rRNA (adenine(2503)-C(2))-methyltransferase RlmN [Firmicutes bacterium]|nr:23S rRNA (adenine(2503)-C(2))-methyltransferase RlmN [Bacillota bacterium]
MRNLKDLFPAELAGVAKSLGAPAYRGRQIFRWLHARAAKTFEEMTDLPAELRAELAQRFSTGYAPVILRQEDPFDGTAKYLLRMADGAVVETVRMEYRYGASVCVSSQVGCRQGCIFCASTIGGKERDLTAGEMIEEVLAVQRELPAGRRVHSVVVMGMGEPLENYDEVLRFVRLAHEPDGLHLSYRHLTVSTCGIVPGIDRLAGENLPITLAVSLHAPNDELRNRLLPVNRRWPLAELMRAVRDYIARTGRRVTFEYAMILDTNDSPEHARELAALLQGVLCHVNLIPLNPIQGSPLGASPRQRIVEFRAILQSRGIPTTIRRQLGLAIEAACGQLRRRELTGEAKARRLRGPLPVLPERT